MLCVVNDEYFVCNRSDIKQRRSFLNPEKTQVKTQSVRNEFRETLGGMIIKRFSPNWNFMSSSFNESDQIKDACRKMKSFDAHRIVKRFKPLLSFKVVGELDGKFEVWASLEGEEIARKFGNSISRFII